MAEQSFYKIAKKVKAFQWTGDNERDLDAFVRQYSYKVYRAFEGSDIVLHSLMLDRQTFFLHKGNWVCESFRPGTGTTLDHFDPKDYLPEEKINRLPAKTIKTATVDG